jgi:hypothetical protein
VIDHGTAHDEGAFRFVTAANVFEDEDIAVADEFRVATVNRIGIVLVDAIGSAPLGARTTA